MCAIRDAALCHCKCQKTPDTDGLSISRPTRGESDSENAIKISLLFICGASMELFMLVKISQKKMKTCRQRTVRIGGTHTMLTRKQQNTSAHAVYGWSRSAPHADQVDARAFVTYSYCIPGIVEFEFTPLTISR